jgi:NAD(P)-dependent dehydrogenase (short-subunit alcohol dehydrogenase family)
MKGPLLILDATGSIGRAVVQAALEAGRGVVAVSLDYAGLKRLRAAHPRADLTLVPGSVADETSAAALAADLRELERPLAGVVIAQCSEMPRGRVLAQSNQALRDALDAELLPQLAAARALLPLLSGAARTGSYVVIGGPGGEQPWAGYGHRSISAAATRMLLRVLHDEARALSVRVQLLSVEMPVRTDDNQEHACVQWPTALAIGARALALIDQVEHLEPNGSPQPAEAVVRFACHATPPLADRRAVHAQAATRRRREPLAAAPSAAATTAAAVGDADEFPSDSPPPAVLEDAWRMLEPLLTTEPKKA